MHAKITSINLAPEGGVPKHPVRAARLRTDGVEGDRQRNLKYHGGPDRAVCLYAAERINALNDEGHPIKAGDVGENLTVEGLDWDALAPGSRLRVGESQLEITTYTTPCQNIAFAFRDGQSKRISQKLHPGWSRLYARVIVEGEVKLGDPVIVEAGPDLRVASKE